MPDPVIIITGPKLAAYGFPGGHPFGSDRHDAFIAGLEQSPCVSVFDRRPSREAAREEMEYFHTPAYVDLVIKLSATGVGYLDGGDTPAYEGVYEAAAHTVGGTLSALQSILEGPVVRAFNPIGGLHHAARDKAAGFCVFNDAAIAIDAALNRFGLERVAYVDIDAHHGDGVFYGYEDDPRIVFADVHEDGRFLYPGTGSRSETGKGEAIGTKLNIPMPPGADDSAFFSVWDEVEAHVEAGKPQLIFLQCGADSLAGDPITHLSYSANAHSHAALRLRALADRYCDGRILAMGGGGYHHPNLASAWTRVVESLAGHCY